MTIIREIELDECVYTVEASITPEESCSWDYIGSPATVDVFTIYDEQGCEITSALDYLTYWELEHQIIEYYNSTLD